MYCIIVDYFYSGGEIHRALSLQVCLVLPSRVQELCYQGRYPHLQVSYSSFIRETPIEKLLEDEKRKLNNIMLFYMFR